jgi:hypothetical protein
MYLLVLWTFLLGSFQISQIESYRFSNHPKTESRDSNEVVRFKNKTVPKVILDPVLKALAYFPDLDSVDITFEFKEKISGAVMQAQPKIFSLFVDGKEKRKYRVKITRVLELGDDLLPIEEVPVDALVGWIGHELGHVMDYLKRSSTDMMHFGARYFLSKKKVIEAELTADGYAIGCGMGHQILANKTYILNNEGFDEEYRDKIKSLYMSPDQIISMSEALEK